MRGGTSAVNKGEHFGLTNKNEYMRSTMDKTSFYALPGFYKMNDPLFVTQFAFFVGFSHVISSHKLLL